MTFPQDYPFSPPSLKLTSQFWHPNGTQVIYINSYLLVYKDGKVCISILHPPVNDPMVCNTFVYLYCRVVNDLKNVGHLHKHLKLFY